MKVIIQQPDRNKRIYQNLPERRVEQEKELVDPVEDPVVPTLYSNDEPSETWDESDISEPAQYSEHTTWKNSRWVPVLLVGVAIVIGISAYFGSHYEDDIPLEKIRVEGANLIGEKEIVKLAHIDRAQKFYSIDLKAIAANIERHTLVRRALPRREVNPATIVLQIEERQPIALVHATGTGETFIVDQDGVLLRPRKMSGLRNADSLLRVPTLSGISERDTASYRTMAKLVQFISSLDSGSLGRSLVELNRSSAGVYTLYLTSAHIPVLLGSPSDAPFHTMMDAEYVQVSKDNTTLFIKQLQLLASMWREGLRNDARTKTALYIDARYDGQIVVRPRPGSDPVVATHALQNAKTTKPPQQVSELYFGGGETPHQANTRSFSIPFSFRGGEVIPTKYPQDATL